jgi:hypothetical protein
MTVSVAASTFQLLRSSQHVQVLKSVEPAVDFSVKFPAGHAGGCGFEPIAPAIISKGYVEVVFHFQLLGRRSSFATPSLLGTQNGLTSLPRIIDRRRWAM